MTSHEGQGAAPDKQARLKAIIGGTSREIGVLLVVFGPLEEVLRSEHVRGNAVVAFIIAKAQRG